MSMFDVKYWMDYEILSTFIVNHRYITVWSRYRTPRQVIDAVLELSQELDDTEAASAFAKYREKSFVILSACLFSKKQLDASGIMEIEPPLIDIFLE